MTTVVEKMQNAAAVTFGIRKGSSWLSVVVGAGVVTLKSPGVGVLVGAGGAQKGGKGGGDVVVVEVVFGQGGRWGGRRGDGSWGRGGESIEADMGVGMEGRVMVRRRRSWVEVKRFIFLRVCFFLSERVVVDIDSLQDGEEKQASGVKRRVGFGSGKEKI